MNSLNNRVLPIDPEPVVQAFPGAIPLPPQTGAKKSIGSSGTAFSANALGHTLADATSDDPIDSLTKSVARMDLKDNDKTPSPFSTGSDGSNAIAHNITQPHSDNSLSSFTSLESATPSPSLNEAISRASSAPPLVAHQALDIVLRKAQNDLRDYCNQYEERITACDRSIEKYYVHLDQIAPGCRASLQKALQQERGQIIDQIFLEKIAASDPELRRRLDTAPTPAERQRIREEEVPLEIKEVSMQIRRTLEFIDHFKSLRTAYAQAKVHVQEQIQVLERAYPETPDFNKQAPYAAKATTAIQDDFKTMKGLLHDAQSALEQAEQHYGHALAQVSEEKRVDHYKTVDPYLLTVRFFLDATNAFFAREQSSLHVYNRRAYYARMAADCYEKVLSTEALKEEIVPDGSTLHQGDSAAALKAAANARLIAYHAAYCYMHAATTTQQEPPQRNAPLSVSGYLSVHYSKAGALFKESFKKAIASAIAFAQNDIQKGTALISHSEALFLASQCKRISTLLCEAKVPEQDRGNQLGSLDMMEAAYKKAAENYGQITRKLYEIKQAKLNGEDLAEELLTDEVNDLTREANEIMQKTSKQIQKITARFHSQTRNLLQIG